MSVISASVQMPKGENRMANKDNQSKLNEMQIENAEALTITELPEVVIECSGTGEGKCYKPDFTRFVMCGERMVYECQYSGHQVDYCTTC